MSFVETPVIDPVDTPNPALHTNMVHIPGGTFRMGSDRHYPEEAPVHRVTVDAFCLNSSTNWGKGAGVKKGKKGTLTVTSVRMRTLYQLNQ